MTILEAVLQQCHRSFHCRKSSIYWKSIPWTRSFGQKMMADDDRIPAQQMALRDPEEISSLVVRKVDALESLEPALVHQARRASFSRDFEQDFAKCLQEAALCFLLVCSGLIQ